ncbi:MAG: sigma-54 interaction domain-containing protein [Planctomycetota bacterium]|jgi:transcriptional regulator with PAS, ATPase and Fis domain
MKSNEKNTDLNPAYNNDYIVKKLLDLAYDGIIVVDTDGIITLISKAYTDFLGISESDAIGKHVTEVIENTRLPQTLKTGKTEEAQLQLINGNYMVASRFPLVSDGAIIGAIGKVLFRDIEELDSLHKQINSLKKQLEDFQLNSILPGQAKYSLRNIAGISDEILFAKEMAQKGAQTDSSILLLGESGTGKELFAHAIHQQSSRTNNPFIKVNCAAIPEELLESELFGYVEGAFTGAVKGGKPGKFEIADRGTLFLDEIGDMPLNMQAKLLRVLQEREIEKIGSKYPLTVDVRIISATNVDLKKLIENGKFREDLFYRLNVFSINIPSLRERPEDIHVLVPYLLNKICNRLGKYIEQVSPEAMAVLKSFDWPGNVRELENVIEHAINLIEPGGVIELCHLPERIGGHMHDIEIKPLSSVLGQSERQAIEGALSAAKGNKAKAARLLKISRSNLYKRMLKLNM